MSKSPKQTPEGSSRLSKIIKDVARCVCLSHGGGLYPLLTYTPAPPPIASRRPPSHLASLSLTARQATTRERRGQSESEEGESVEWPRGPKGDSAEADESTWPAGGWSGGVASTPSPPGTSWSLPRNEREEGGRGDAALVSHLASQHLHLRVRVCGGAGKGRDGRRRMRRRRDGEASDKVGLWRRAALLLHQPTADL